MGKKLIFDYTFDASQKTIVLEDIYAQERFLLITNISTGDIIYQFNDINLSISNISFDYDKSETTLTLAFDTTSMTDNDVLQIYLDEGSTDITVNERFIDPVSKIRVSNPENLIDTDFEYGLQSTKWETLELTNNIPTFFSRSGDESLVLSSMNVQAGSNVVTVVTSLPHGFQRGTPIIVQASGSVSADGGFVVASIIDASTFNYKAKTSFLQTRLISETFTLLFPGSIYSGTEFKLTNIGGITTDGAAQSALTVNTVFPTDFETGTSMALTNSFAKATVSFSTADVEIDNTKSLNISYVNATATGEEDNFFLGGVNGITWLPRETSMYGTPFYFEEGTTTIDTGADTVTFTEPHGFQTYDNVLYVCDSSTNTPISGLSAMHVYTVVRIDDYTLRFANNRSTSTFYKIALGANGASAGVVKSALIGAYFHRTYYSFDYGFMYTGSVLNTATEFTGSSADSPLLFTAYANYGQDSRFNVASDVFDPSTVSLYDYYGTYYTSIYYYYVWTSTTSRLFTGFTSSNYMGAVPINFSVNKSTIWVPNHDITDPTVVTITATVGTLPGGLSSGSPYIAERVNDNRLSFKNLNGSDVNFTTNGSTNLQYNVSATIPLEDANTIEIAGNTLNEGDALAYYNASAKDNSGTDIGGLTDGTTYYAALKIKDKFQLSTESNVFGATSACLAQNSFTWVNLTANTLLLNSNPYSNGDALQYAAITPVVPLTSGSIYYVRTVSGNTVALYYSKADAIADTNRVDLLAYGSGRGNFTELKILDITSTPSPDQTQVFEADFVGAADGNYVVSSTSANGLAFDFESSSEIQARTKVVTAQASLAISLNALYISDHGFITGDSVVVTLTGTTNLNGLTSGDTYYIARINKDFVKFSSTEEEAIAGTYIALSESGTSATELTGTISLAPTTIVGSFNGSGTVTFSADSLFATGEGTTFTSYFNKGDVFFINEPEATQTTDITGVNTSTDVFTAVGHGMTSGDMVRFSGDAAPGSINFNNVYFANAASVNTFSVHFTETDALAASNKIALSTTGTNASVTDVTSAGGMIERQIYFVNSESLITFTEALPSTGLSEVNYLQTTGLLLRPDGFALHRPYDGGVELIPPTNPDSQMIRQTRKYFRYQSGKGIQVSFAVNFSPTSQIDIFTRSGEIGTVVSRFPHRLSQDLFVTMSGSTNTANDAIGTSILNVTVGTSPEDPTQNKFIVDDDYYSTYSLYEGRTYRFDQSESTNATHPLRFSEQEDGTHNPSGTGTEYTTGVTKVGTPGTAGAYTQITVATGAPTLYVYCEVHSGMGFTTPTIVDPSNNSTNLWNGSHKVLSVVDDFTFTVQLDGSPSDNNAFGVVEYYVNNWENSSLRCGLYDDQNGIFFEYDGQTLYCCRRSSIRQISGYANLEFRSSEVVGQGTKFASQLSVGDYVVIKGQSHRVSRIDGDELMYMTPSYRGVSSEKVIITKTETKRVQQSEWNMDVCDGTGYTGFKLDIHKIQMAYIDYSWYGAGKVRFGFKDQHGNVRYIHSFVHGNFFTEAYMRSGNVPARYEVQNIGLPSYVPALAHWGTSVIMDGRFDPDKAYIFNATSSSLTLTGLSQLTVDGKIDYSGFYYQRIGRQNYPIGYAILLDSASSTLNSVTSGTVITGADLSANTSASNPSSGAIFPYQSYLPSISSREGTSFFTQAARNLLVINKAPTGTSVGSTTYSIGEASGADINVTKNLPLISIRLAPSVDTGAPGFLGEREIINRMQLILNQVGILSTHAGTIKLILNGQLSTNAWERVQTPSLSQVINHDNSDIITGGQSVYNFEVQGGTGDTGRQPVLTTEALGDIATLGNAILGGDNVYPDGPDVLTVVAILTEDPSTVSGTNPFQVSGRISWSESQA
tara:strand:- start:10843 stop:16455 length:5613 start_codon:yes stop_codon:yes gene_type:complete